MTDAELKPFGWAPGGYIILCMDCPSSLSFLERGMGDKRCWRCRAHAIEAAKNTKLAPSRAGWMEAGV